MWFVAGSNARAAQADNASGRRRHGDSSAERVRGIGAQTVLDY